MECDELWPQSVCKIPSEKVSSKIIRKKKILITKNTKQKQKLLWLPSVKATYDIG